MSNWILSLDKIDFSDDLFLHILSLHVLLACTGKKKWTRPNIISGRCVLIESKFIGLMLSSNVVGLIIDELNYRRQ
jgi:hypothetical protein